MSREDRLKARMERHRARWERKRERWERRREQWDRNSSGRLIAGLFVITLGLVFLASSFGWFSARTVFRTAWPLFLVAVGISMLSKPAHRHGRQWGWVFITVGIWWFLDKIGLVSVSIWQLFLPAVLLFAGGMLVWRALRDPRSRHNPTDFTQPNFTPSRFDLSSRDGPTLDTGESSFQAGTPGADSTTGTETAAGTGATDGGIPGAGATAGAYTRPDDHAEFVSTFAFMSSNELRPVSRPFRGADLGAMMAGVKLDLTGARMEGDTAVVEVFAFWGGIEIFVPPDWTVTSKVTTLMGGFIDKRRPTSIVPTKTLVLTGFVMMAGLEVKN